MFEVTVKALDGKTKTIQIEDDVWFYVYLTTIFQDILVSGFKQILHEQMVCLLLGQYKIQEIAIESQRLIFQGKVLIDDKKLKDCGEFASLRFLTLSCAKQVNILQFVCANDNVLFANFLMREV